MVIDTSALLSLVFAEPHAPWVAARMNEAAALQMSTVNLAESLIRIRDRQPTLYPMLERQILGGMIAFTAPTTEHARLAAEARMRFPLNLGDCFAYALATTTHEPLLTLDNDFRHTDIEVVLPGK